MKKTPTSKKFKAVNQPDEQLLLSYLNNKEMIELVTTDLMTACHKQHE